MVGESEEEEGRLYQKKVHHLGIPLKSQIFFINLPSK